MCWRICAFTALGAILSPLPVVSPGGKVCLCCYGDVVKGTGTSLPSTLLQSSILFLKKTLFPHSPRKKRKAKRPCFKQSQEATISLCIMIRHGKARRGRRVLVPSPLNSLLCIRQQQQYKQTSQRRVDETLNPSFGPHRCCLLVSVEVKHHRHGIAFSFVSNVILTAWPSTVLALQLKVLTLECSVRFICEFHWVWGLNT